MAKPQKLGNKWRIRPVDENGKRKSFVFGSFKEAQSFLKQYEARTELIKKGMDTPRQERKKFNELADYYLEFHSTEKRNFRNDTTIIRLHLKPHFNNCYLDQVSFYLDPLRQSKKHLNDKTVHNILTLLGTMLRVAVDNGWLSRVPKIKKPKITYNDKDYRYLRNDDEIKKFLWAAKHEKEVVYYLYLTALNTGMRAGELAGLKWSDIDFERRLIMVNRSYLNPTKNKKTRAIPILDSLLPQLREWKLKSFGEFVFYGETGRRLQPSARAFQEVFRRVLDRADFPSKYRNGKTKRYITFHGLRHTFASHWMMQGGCQFKLQRILGHSGQAMTEKYSHLSPDAFAGDYSIFSGTNDLQENRTIVNFGGKNSMV